MIRWAWCQRPSSALAPPQRPPKKKETEHLFTQARHWFATFRISKVARQKWDRWTNQVRATPQRRHQIPNWHPRAATSEEEIWSTSFQPWIHHLPTVANVVHRRHQLPNNLLWSVPMREWTSLQWEVHYVDTNIATPSPRTDITKITDHRVQRTTGKELEHSHSALPPPEPEPNVKRTKTWATRA